MATSVSDMSGIADRYVSALFDLAVEEKALPAVEKDLVSFDKMIQESPELAQTFASPLTTRDEQASVVDALLAKAKISGLVGNFIRVLAQNHRLAIAPAVLGSFKRMLADHNGEVTAEVTVASALTAAQQKDVEATLKSVVGKEVAVTVTVDPSILGGMIVKVGSRQIDTSLKTKLSSLKLALNEVG